MIMYYLGNKLYEPDIPFYEFFSRPAWNKAFPAFQNRTLCCISFCVGSCDHYYWVCAGKDMEMGCWLVLWWNIEAQGVSITQSLKWRRKQLTHLYDCMQRLFHLPSKGVIYSFLKCRVSKLESDIKEILTLTLLTNSCLSRSQDVLFYCNNYLVAKILSRGRGGWRLGTQGFSCVCMKPSDWCPFKLQLAKMQWERSSPVLNSYPYYWTFEHEPQHMHVWHATGLIAGGSCSLI